MLSTYTNIYEINGIYCTQCIEMFELTGKIMHHIIDYYEKVLNLIEIYKELISDYILLLEFSVN